MNTDSLYVSAGFRYDSEQTPGSFHLPCLHFDKLLQDVGWEILEPNDCSPFLLFSPAAL